MSHFREIEFNTKIVGRMSTAKWNNTNNTFRTWTVQAYDVECWLRALSLVSNRPGFDSSSSLLNVWPWHITEPLLRFSFFLCRMGKQWSIYLIGLGRITHITHLARWHIVNMEYMAVIILKSLWLSFIHSEHVEISSLIMFEFSSLNTCSFFY